MKSTYNEEADSPHKNNRGRIESAHDTEKSDIRARVTDSLLNEHNSNGHGKRKRVSTNTYTKSNDGRREMSSSSVHTFRSEEREGYKEHVYVARDGTEFRANDCIYLVCEPPNEPYYLGRIMEFTKLESQSIHLDAVRVNWFYRPRDIQRQNTDSRLLFATMHSDISPINAIRGKCSILHKSQVTDLETYRKQENCFYYEKLFDKFMRRQYEVVPVNAVTNVPNQVKEVLLQRWKYVVVESNRSKELSMEHRSCRTCSRWCSPKDSVRCAICHSDFHMNCVSPPLPRKPSRGFAWSCTPCSTVEATRLQRLENFESMDNEIRAEDVKQFSTKDNDTIAQATAQMNSRVESSPPTTLARRSSRPELWPFRYLGIHCNINDAVDHDDRIYPRAASRIGQRHQAAVPDWHGHPVEYFEKVKRPIKRTPKAMKGRRMEERAVQDMNSSNAVTLFSDGKEEFVSGNRHFDPSTLSVSERPPWLQQRPLNYIARGEGTTSECQWIPPANVDETQIRDYLALVGETAKRLSIDGRSPNFLDVALKILFQSDFNATEAAKKMACISRADIGESTFSTEELSRFEMSIKKNGSELAQVAHDVGSKSTAECVRFYYLWKKTIRAAKIRAHSEGHKMKFGAATPAVGISETMSNGEVIADSSDDSAYSITKVTRMKRSFQCKFCASTSSSRWRRAPGGSDSKNPIIALCQRCAVLWRHYAVTWEPPEEVYRKLNEGSQRGRKRKIEQELLKELPQNGSRPTREENFESTRALKKVKKVDNVQAPRLMSAAIAPSCSICLGNNDIDCRSCSSCGLFVHSACYGLQGQTNDNNNRNWTCDTCRNSLTPSASNDYTCILCYYRAGPGTTHSAAMKKTASKNWVHVSCAIWNPYVTFGNTSKLEPVEGINAMPLDQWERVCELCGREQGSCSSCSICGKAVHVECARRADFKLAFDLQAVKSSQSRREGLSLVRIGAEGGLLTPVIYCPAHKIDETQLHAPDDLIAEEKETVLALYARVYKGSQQNHTLNAPRTLHDDSNARPLLLNTEVIEAKRLELGGQDVNSYNKVATMSISKTHCHECNIDVSPHFYRCDVTAGSLDRILCHRCHWQATD